MKSDSIYTWTNACYVAAAFFLGLATWVLTKASRFCVSFICKEYKDLYIIRYDIVELPKLLFA